MGIDPPMPAHGGAPIGAPPPAVPPGGPLLPAAAPLQPPPPVRPPIPPPAPVGLPQINILGTSTMDIPATMQIGPQAGRTARSTARVAQANVLNVAAPGTATAPGAVIQVNGTVSPVYMGAHKHFQAITNELRNIIAAGTPGGGPWPRYAPVIAISVVADNTVLGGRLVVSLQSQTQGDAVQDVNKRQLLSDVSRWLARNTDFPFDIVPFSAHTYPVNTDPNPASNNIAHAEMRGRQVIENPPPGVIFTNRGVFTSRGFCPGCRNGVSQSLAGLTPKAFPVFPLPYITIQTGPPNQTTGAAYDNTVI